MSFIVTVIHKGNEVPLRGTVWAMAMDRATIHATREDAEAALLEGEEVHALAGLQECDDQGNSGRVRRNGRSVEPFADEPVEVETIPAFLTSAIEMPATGVEIDPLTQMPSAVTLGEAVEPTTEVAPKAAEGPQSA